MHAQHVISSPHAQYRPQCDVICTALFSCMCATNLLLPLLSTNKHPHPPLPSSIIRPQRDVIYTALLSHMSAEHKFSTAAKLCNEVLAGVADGLLPLEECGEVLRDALHILASKDIKASVCVGGGHPLQHALA